MAAGAVLAGGVIYAALVMPIRTQLKGEQEAQTRRIESQSARIKNLEGQIAALQADVQITRHVQNQLAQMQQDLSRTKRELAALQAQNRILLARTVPAPDRTESLPPALAKYLDQPQLALDEGKKELLAVATQTPHTMGSGQNRRKHVEPLSPVARIVESQSPTFGWRPIAGASHYRVDIHAQKSRRDLLPNEPTKNTQWTMPGSLPRNDIYSWQVLAYDRKDRELARSPSVSFKVLNARTVRDLEDSIGSPLARGIIYAKAGMPDEAAAELTKYLRKKPGSTQALRLQETIKALKQKMHEPGKG